MEYLESVKTRLVQLHESIHFFLRSINPETTPGTVSWYVQAVALSASVEIYQQLTPLTQNLNTNTSILVQ